MKIFGKAQALISNIKIVFGHFGRVLGMAFL
jgi:hypothetical protein